MSLKRELFAPIVSYVAALADIKCLAIIVRLYVDGVVTLSFWRSNEH